MVFAKNRQLVSSTRFIVYPYVSTFNKLESIDFFALSFVLAFASYGMFKIFFDEDYSVGKKMAKVVRAITKKHQALNKSNSLNFDFRAHILLVRKCVKKFDSTT